MALGKEVSHPTGFNPYYWMIENFVVQKKATHARLVLAGYKSQTVRDEAPEEGVIARRTIAMNGEDFETWYQDVVVDKTLRAYEAAYEYIKTHEEFAGAEDIFE